MRPIVESFVRKTNATGKHFCPVCDSRVREFLPTPWGNPPRLNAQCPICDSLERHRLDWVFFKERTALFDEQPKRILHVAPEKRISALFKSLKGADYVSGDLDGSKAMMELDITKMPFSDNLFTIIYCSHVLEHVPDDKRALRELFRVMHPDGWAVLNVPLSGDKTYEDFSITDPKDREQHFGQWDHVRVCGLDYLSRIKEVGFTVDQVMALDLLSEVDAVRMGVNLDRKILFCKKNSDNVLSS